MEKYSIKKIKFENHSNLNVTHCIELPFQSKVIVLSMESREGMIQGYYSDSDNTPGIYISKDNDSNFGLVLFPRLKGWNITAADWFKDQIYICLTKRAND